MKRTHSLALIVATLFALTGCYWTDVQPNQMGVTTSGGAIDAIVGPGQHLSLSPYADLHIYDASAKTITHQDGDLLTSNRVPIGVEVAASYARSTNPDDVTNMWTQYNAEAQDDAALEAQVRTRLPAVTKAVTVKYTLDELLGVSGGEDVGRTIATQELFDQLAPELAEFGVRLLDIRFSNFTPDAEYMARLSEKTQVELQKQINADRVGAAEQELKAEQAKTAVEVEKAERASQVAAAQNAAYDQSDRAYELERMRLLGEIIGQNDKIIVSQDGANLALLFSDGSQQVVPLEQQPAAQPSTPLPTPEATEPAE